MRSKPRPKPACGTVPERLRPRDARGDEIKIDIDPDLPRVRILLVDKSEAKIFEPDQLSTPTELIKILANAKAK